MRNRIPFIYWLGLALLWGNLLWAQPPRLVGRLHLHSGWVRVLYVQAISDMDNLGAVDSIIPDSTGHFIYPFTDQDQRSGLVRLWVVPFGAPRNTSIEGTNENQCFLAIPPLGEDLIWEGDANALFYSSQLNSSELNRLILWMRDLKIPFRDWMEEQEAALAADSAVKSIHQPGIYAQWLDLLEEYRHQIAQKLNESLPDPIKLLGLYYWYRSNLGRYDPDFFQNILSTFRSRHWTLYQKIRKELRVINKANAHPFLPGIPLLDSAEQAVTLPALLGTYTVLDFWASWCGPCRVANRVTLPQISDLLRLANCTLISVSVDHDREKWLNALREDAPSWTQLLDPASDFSLKEYFAITSYPTYMVFDNRGRHVYTSHADADLQRFLDKAGVLQMNKVKYKSGLVGPRTGR